MDTDTLQQLGELDGNIICFCYQANGNVEVAKQWYLLPSEAGLTIYDDYDKTPDVTIISNLAAISSLMSGNKSSRKLATSQMTVQGDIELGERVKKIAMNIELDWEGQLSKYIGDIAAHQIGNFSRKAHNISSQIRSNLIKDIVEVSQEEYRLLPNKFSVDQHFKEIHQLQTEVDALEKRIQRLQETRQCG